MRLVLIVEDRADAEAASMLADRVFIEGDAGWIDAETLPSLREWTGIEPETRYTRWVGLGQLATRHRIKAHGRGLGPDGAAARKALLLVIQTHAQDDNIQALVLVRDMDNQPERRASMESARAELADKLAFQVAIAAPDPKREAWILHGFEPQNDNETTLLADQRKTLGFDPVTNPERLRGDRRKNADQADRDMKLVIERLTHCEYERELQCLETTLLSVLRERGQATGLTAYLAEVETRLLPLLDPGASAGTAVGLDA
ncbi:hypothetical protein [Thiohalocapsa sp. ML1]|uniref:hypothetical protein n=1 Tax=Thiohalocapsa sp. ML1 TaxID=1431688 RepID=UPI00073231FA|nr:hypothetical protein [Thiohalocapsa sp. ML1]